jgi:hypothetical protein
LPRGLAWEIARVAPGWLRLRIHEFLSYKIFINNRALDEGHFDPFFQWLC